MRYTWPTRPVCVRLARACGYEAKTDPRDAQVLSRYGLVFPDAQTPEFELEPEREELRDLLNRRRQFMQQRVQELGRLDKGTTSVAAESTKRHIAWHRTADLGHPELPICRKLGHWDSRALTSTGWSGAMVSRQ